MLQNLREHVHGWLAGVIGGVLCLAFALWGVESYLNNGPSQTIAAKVNGEEITQQAVEIAYDRAKQSQLMQFSDPAMNALFQKQIKAKALSGLIQQQVLMQSAQKAGYLISPAQVGNTLQQMPAFLQNGQFSYALFQRVLSNLSYTEDTFLQEMNKAALLNQVEQSLVESNFASKEEATHALELENQKRDIGYFLIDTQRFLSTISVTEQSIQAYYKENSEQFKTPEQISLQYLKLSVEDMSQKIVPTDQMLMEYYEQNKSSFSTLKQPQDFANAKPEVKKKFIQQKSEELIAEEGDKLANLAYTHSDSLKPAADALGLSIQTTALFTRQGDTTGFLSNPKILAAAFSDTVLKQRNNSDIISLDDHTAVVLRIADYKPPVLKPLSEVHSSIENILKQKEAQNAATQLGENILAKLQKGTPPPTIRKRK